MIAAVLAVSGALYSQTLAVTPKSVKLLQVERGPLANVSISIRSAGAPQAWTATASTGDLNDPWVWLSAASGETPATLTVGPVDWRGEQRKPGKYQASIAIKSGGESVTVPVEWEVRRGIAPAAFSYLSGPVGCEKADGYPDSPLCRPLPLTDLLSGLSPGTSYVDPNFGATVRIMTGHPVYHTYPTPSPLSAHNKYLMTYPENGTWDILDVATARFVLRRAPCNQSFFWDAANDEVYYYMAVAAIVKHDLRANTNTVLVDYSKQPQFHFHEILRGGTGDNSKDNWISFWAPDEKQVCAVDLNNVKTYCADYSATQRKLPYGDIDFTLISKGVDRQTGKRYIMLVAPPAMGVFSVDMAGGTLKPEFRGP
ncbi:MAG TPA: hypothetical protein VGH29_06985 [Candidatus Binataceae bacterium]